MEAFLVSTGVVALAEIGDKTQLLALLLATRLRRPWPIVLGILVATLANHAFASAVGAWLVELIGGTGMRWILGLSFIAMAVWTLIPDSAPEERSAFTRVIRVIRVRESLRNYDSDEPTSRRGESASLRLLSA